MWFQPPAIVEGEEAFPADRAEVDAAITAVTAASDDDLDATGSPWPKSSLLRDWHEHTYSAAGLAVMKPDIVFFHEDLPHDFYGARVSFCSAFASAECRTDSTEDRVTERRAQSAQYRVQNTGY